MKLFIFLLSLFIIGIGIATLCLLIFTAVSGKDVDYVSYTPKSVNEAEYGLRTLLFMYPNAEIHTVENSVSARLMSDYPRIIVHQET